MQSLQHHLLNIRTRITRPLRRHRVAALAAAGRAPMSVLFYHRVADTSPNAWTMSCREFERQVDYCRQNFDLITLTQLQQRSRDIASDRASVSLTFDDGYAENCRFAIPLLIRHRVPCTYFVSVQHVQSGLPFAHDLECGVPLAVNTIDELRAMVDGGIEIGLHTRSHFDFSRPATDEQIRSEIVDAAAELADAIGRPIRYFAFPFGLRQQLAPAVVDAVRQAGLVGYCSAYGAYNFPGDDPFHIRRIHADPEFAALENWLTFDSRKVRRENKQVAIQTQRVAASLATMPRPLNTLFVITSMPVGGAETLLVNLMDRFDPAKIKPSVVCLKQPGPLGEQIASRHPVYSDLTRSKFDFAVLPRLVRLMKSQAIDAVVTVGAGDKMFWGRLAARLAGVPVCCSALHSTGWPDGVGRLNRMLTPITDGFIAVAAQHGIHLSKHEGFPADRVHIIRNGIDCERFRPRHDSYQSIRHSLGLPPQTKLVGIVAALRAEKNHAMLIDVAANVHRVRDDVHFVIVGDGPERGMIERKINEHKLESRVHLLGTRHDTDRIVAALNLFLLCSHNEASPVSILEALACEVPVVSTRVGSVDESVIDGVTGHLVAVDDRNAMSQYALSLLSDDQVRGDMGRRGRELVLSTGSLDSMVDGYTRLIEWLFQAKCGKLPMPKIEMQSTKAASWSMVEQVN